MEEKVKIRPTIESLEIGESYSFPIERLRSVRSIASEVSLVKNVKLRTSTDRNNRTVSVRRLM